MIAIFEYWIYYFDFNITESYTPILEDLHQEESIL